MCVCVSLSLLCMHFKFKSRKHKRAIYALCLLCYPSTCENRDALKSDIKINLNCMRLALNV